MPRSWAITFALPKAAWAASGSACPASGTVKVDTAVDGTAATVALDVATAVEKLAVWACADALPDETIVLTKRYDDLVDSGIAWLTALAFAHENYHVLAAPDGDGHIVGPAHLPSIPEPLKVRHPPKISSPVSESATLIAKGVSCYCGCGTATGSFFALASRVHTNRARHVSSCRRILQGTQRVHQ